MAAFVVQSFISSSPVLTGDDKSHGHCADRDNRQGKRADRGERIPCRSKNH